MKGEGFAGRWAGRDMLAKGMGFETEMGWGKGQAGCPSLSVHRQKHKQTRVYKIHKSENSISAVFQFYRDTDERLLLIQQQLLHVLLLLLLLHIYFSSVP